MFTEKANVICYHCACKVPNSDYCFNCGKKINMAFSGFHNAITNPVHQHKNISHIDQTNYKRNRYKPEQIRQTSSLQNSEWQSRYMPSAASPQGPETYNSSERFIKKYQQREYFDREKAQNSMYSSGKKQAQPTRLVGSVVLIIIFAVITLIPMIIAFLRDLN